MKITFYHPGIFKNHEKKQYYKMHVNLEFTILMDFSVESGYLCSFSKSGNPQVYPYVQGERIRILKPVIYFEILLDFFASLVFSAILTCSIRLIHFVSQHPSFLTALFFLFLKGFVGKITQKEGTDFEKIFFYLIQTCVLKGFQLFIQFIKYSMRHDSGSFQSHYMQQYVCGPTFTFCCFFVSFFFSFFLYLSAS